jgi:DNA-binding MarR family transcriptional regulator
MIDRLVSKGLVERAEDPADRRVVTCALTSVGENAVERFMRIGRHKIESIADALSVEELEIVTHAMEIMADAAGRAPAAVASEDQEPASMKA